MDYIHQFSAPAVIKKDYCARIWDGFTSCHMLAGSEMALPFLCTFLSPRAMLQSYSKVAGGDGSRWYTITWSGRSEDIKN